ncbi:MAG: hypothetical protein CMN72_13135 [Sphingomonas sp.]|nr:hypothetical protein [Sphingomonas sp.]
MMPHNHSSGESSSSTPVTVEVPRVYDGLGAALKKAYGRDAGLPDDMLRALDRLDRVERRGKSH